MKINTEKFVAIKILPEGFKCYKTVFYDSVIHTFNSTLFNKINHK